KSLCKSIGQTSYDNGSRNFVSHPSQFGVRTLVVMQTNGLFPGSISLQSFTLAGNRFQFAIERIFSRSYKCIRSQTRQTEYHNGIGQSSQVPFFVVRFPGTEDHFCRITVYVTRKRHDPVRLSYGSCCPATARSCGSRNIIS